VGGVSIDSITAEGQLPHLLNNLRFVNDYFIRAHSAPNELWGQVGTGGSDHSFWGSAEVMHLRTTRPSARITLSCGGSDLAAETAAAMAASSIVFRPTDPAYADTLLAHARQLFDFAEATHPSFYVDCIPDAAGFYNSHFGNPNDEMAWAAIWLHRATDEPLFLERPENIHLCTETGTSTRATWSRLERRHFTARPDGAGDREPAFASTSSDGSTLDGGRGRTRAHPEQPHVRGRLRPHPLCHERRLPSLVYADLIGPSDHSSPLPRLRQATGGLRPRRQSRTQLRGGLREQPSAKPAPPDRARDLEQQPQRGAQPQPPYPLRRAGRRPELE
jgi:hypothetical protein